MTNEGVEYFRYVNAKNGSSLNTQQHGGLVFGQVTNYTTGCEINFTIQNGRITSSNARGAEYLAAPSLVSASSRTAPSGRVEAARFA